MVNFRAEEGGSKFKAEPPNRLIPLILYELLVVLEGVIDAGPSQRRVRLRDLRFRLARAYPRIFTLNETELAQALAEEDDDEIEDTDVSGPLPPEA